MIPPEARYVLPEFHERTTAGHRVVDPYSKLLDERIVFVGTQIDDTAANDVIAQLMHLEHAAPEQDISLYINSPGGSFTAMMSIYDAMQFVTCDIETVCLGQAASAAAVLLAAGSPGKRLALPGSRVLIHQPALDGPVRGQTSDLQIMAQEILRTRALMEELLARHSGQEIARVREDLDHDTFLTAEQAVAYGLVDRVTRSRKTSPRRPLG